jgi:hypothetical protein
MTDDRRLDLRSLDAADDPARTEALVHFVMAGIARRPRLDDVRELRRYRVALLAATAAFLVIALGAAGVQRDTPVPASDAIATWARESHIPTNGELLAAYYGYRP